MHSFILRVMNDCLALVILSFDDTSYNLYIQIVQYDLQKNSFHFIKYVLMKKVL